MPIKPPVARLRQSVAAFSDLLEDVRTKLQIPAG